MAKFDKNKYETEYKRQNYDRLTVMVPKGKGDILKEYAMVRGTTVSKLIVEALEMYYLIDLSK